MSREIKWKFMGNTAGLILFLVTWFVLRNLNLAEEALLAGYLAAYVPASLDIYAVVFQNIKKLKIFDEYFGISKPALNFMQNLNLENYMEFRRKFLVNSEEELEDFNQHSPIRTFESCENELKALQNYYTEYRPTFDYDVAILSENDKVFIPSRQKEYYKNKYIELKNNAHNVFYTFKTFDSIIDFTIFQSI